MLITAGLYDPRVHYWEPANHLRLVRLYAASGDYDKAEKALSILEGHREYAEGRKAIDFAREEMKGAVSGEQ